MIALGAAFVHPTVGQAQDAAPRPAAVRAGYTSPLVIPAAEFTNDGAAPSDFLFDRTTGRVQGTDAAGTACMKAPAYLPDGATITELKAFLRDNNDTADVTLNLARTSNTLVSPAQTLATVNSTGSGTAVQTPSDNTVASPLVDLRGYSYYVTTCLMNGNTGLYAVSISYLQP